MPEPRTTAPVTAASGSAGTQPPGRRLAAISRLIRSRPIRAGFVLVTVGLACYALVTDWAQIHGALGKLGPWSLAGALAAVVLALGASTAMWRLLLASMGSPLPIRTAARIVLVGQLGKYLPGSIWPVLAQMELGREHHVPQTRSASASVLQMLFSLIGAMLVAVVTLPFVAGALPYRWALAAAPVLLVLLYPPVINAVIGRVLQIARQGALEKPLTAAALLRALLWAFVSWAFYGLQIWILAVTLGAPPGRTAVVAFGGFAFAWSIGFIVVFAPAGAGIRDVLLLVVLHAVLPTQDAAAVVLVSRVLTIVADLGSAAVAARFVRRPPASPVLAGADNPGRPTS